MSPNVLELRVGDGEDHYLERNVPLAKAAVDIAQLV